MQITLHTAEWNALQKFVREKSDDDNLFDFMDDSPITDAMGDSMIFNHYFGEVVEKCMPGLEPSDAKSLAGFVSTFCGTVVDGDSEPPKDLDVGIFEAMSVMAPSTLKKLIELPSQIDRRRLRALVRQALADGKGIVESAGSFFEYLDGWHRAYRFAEAEHHACVVMVG